MKIPKIFIPEKDLESEIEGLLKEEIKPSETHLKYNKFKVIHANTYAEGIAKLKKQGREPFTFSENVEARIIDYEANGDNAELFKTYLNSVTGIAYKAHSTEFKLILRSDKLENIKSDFKQNFIPIDYDAERGIELDSKKDKYGQLLTREEAKNHKFWLAAMGSDKEKLDRYVNIWFGKTGEKKGMGIYLRSNTSQDEFWALVLYYDGSGSDAGGYYLNNFAQFVSGAQ